jgi:hypothetical protein
MIGAIARALGRLASSISKAAGRLRRTLDGIDDQEERIMQWDTNGDACTACQAKDGTIIKIVNGVPDGQIPPLHPNCDCILRTK